MNHANKNAEVKDPAKTEILSSSTFIYHTLLELRVTNIKEEIFNNSSSEKSAKDNLNDCIRKLVTLKKTGLKARLINNFLLDLRSDLFYQREDEFKEKLDIVIDLVLKWITRTKESYQSYLAGDSELEKKRN